MGSGVVFFCVVEWKEERGESSRAGARNYAVPGGAVAQIRTSELLVVCIRRRQEGRTGTHWKDLSAPVNEEGYAR